jgi:hypothetical protein
VQTTQISHNRSTATNVEQRYCFYKPEVCKLWGGGVNFFRDIFVLNVIWEKDKIYILVGSSLG